MYLAPKLSTTVLFHSLPLQMHGNLRLLFSENNNLTSMEKRLLQTIYVGNLPMYLNQQNFLLNSVHSLEYIYHHYLMLLHAEILFYSYNPVSSENQLNLNEIIGLNITQIICTFSSLVGGREPICYSLLCLFLIFKWLLPIKINHLAF